MQAEYFFHNKYDFNLDSSPLISVTPGARIYQISLKDDPQQLRALKYVDYGPKRSDKKGNQYIPSRKRKIKTWTIAKNHGDLPDSEIYEDSLMHKIVFS